MNKFKKITLFVLALFVAGAISISNTNVEAKVIKPTPKIVKLIAKKPKLTGTALVAYAKRFIGTPYRRGGTTTRGFDCSGFTMYIYNHFNIKLPHNAKNQTAKGIKVSKQNLRVGDLVFFGKSISHVGIYVGSGKFIHSPKPGSKIKIMELKYMPGYTTARRLVPQ